MVAKVELQVMEAKAAAAGLEVVVWLSAEGEEVILLRVVGAEAPSLLCLSLLEIGGPLPLLQASSLLLPSVWNL